MQVGTYTNSTDQSVHLTSSENNKEYPDVRVWGKFGSDTWERVGIVSCAGLVTNHGREFISYEFVPEKDGASFEIEGYDLNQTYVLVLPGGCTGLRLETASARPYCFTRFVLKCSCKPSDFMRSIADSGTMSVINGAAFIARDASGAVLPGSYESRVRYLSSADFEDSTELANSVAHADGAVALSHSTLSSGAGLSVSVAENSAYKRFDLGVAANAYEQANDVGRMDVVDGFDAQSAGTFNILLPLGMTVDVVPRVEVYRIWRPGYAPRGSDALDPSQFGVSITSDWRGTGRSLATIAIHDAGATWIASSTTWDDFVEECVSGFQVNVRGYYSYRSTVDYGTDLSAAMVYETGNDSIASGQSDVGVTVINDPYLGGNQRYLEDMDGDGVVGGAPNKYLYAKGSRKVSLMGSAEATVLGRVSSLAVGAVDWITGVARYADGTLSLPADTSYQYMIRSSTADSLKGGIVLYDSIENFVPGDATDDFGNPQWHGILTGVDVSQIRMKGVDPVVYYSTVSGLDIVTHTNLADSATWSATAPADLSAVTAVAIDCRLANDGTPFVLSDKKSLVAILDMRTPGPSECEAYISQNAHAYNNVFESSIIAVPGSGWVGQLVHDDYTKVGLHILAYSNIHGLLRITSPKTVNAIIPVPWTDYSRDGSPTNDIRVDRLVKPVGFLGGDLLLQYANGGVYKAWILEKGEGGEGVWTPMTTVAQQPLVGGMTNVIASLGADGGFYVRPDGTETQKRGYGLWLVRQQMKNRDIYLYGQWLTGEETVTIGGIDADDVAVHYPGARYGIVHDTLLANPDCTRGTTINAYPWTGCDGADTIILNNDTAAHTYCFRQAKPQRQGGGWYDGWWQFGPSGYTTNGIATPAGVGFWYERRAAGPMTHTWPGATKYPGDGEDHDVWIVDHADAGDGKTHLAIKLEGAFAPTGGVTKTFIRELFDSGRIRYLRASGETQALGKAEMDRLTVTAEGNSLPVPALRNGTGVNTDEELARGWIWVTVPARDGSTYDAGNTNGAGDLLRIVVIWGGM